MRLRIAVICLGVMLAALPCLAQQAMPSPPRLVYDNFNSKWLDPNKWKVGADYCSGNCLEMVREIEFGRLRLAARSVGRLGVDSGTAYAQAALPFPDAVSASLTSIQAEVFVKEYGGVPCPTNTEDMTHAEVFIGGGFFSTSGIPGDWMSDIRASLILWVDTTNPTTLQVGLWWGSGDGTVGTWTPVAAYPLGTPLILRLTWDRLGHRFIGSARSLDPSDSGAEVPADYGALNVAGPAFNFEKDLSAMTNAMSCSVVQSVSHVDTRFDNVIIK